MSTEDHEESVAESVTKLQEKCRNLSKRLADRENHETDLETRLRVLESVESRLEAAISDIDKRLRTFELSHDKRKENWNMAVNFVIQLVWVAMAAFMLAKLGLQPPL